MRKLLFFILPALLLWSCARVGSPVGGAKDTIPPQVVSSNIDSSRVLVPRDIHQLRIDFDEYIMLRDINKNLIISPPLRKITKILPSGTANKYLLIKWEDTLKENTTYSFNFGNAISDNNENNVLRYYNFAFTTGDKIDDLFISGDVRNVLKDKAEKPDDNNVVVGLYQASDSLNYRQKPLYIAKADPEGYFELNYLSPGTYRLLAFSDDNANSVFDPGKEKVAFLKEPLHLKQSISGLKIDLFPSRKAVKYKEMKEIPGGVLFQFEGNPREVKIKPLNPKLQDYRVTHRKNSDSAIVWFDAVKSGLTTAVSENLKFSYDTGVKKDSASVFYRYNPKNEMTLTNAYGNSLPPGRSFRFSSNYVIDRLTSEKWTLVSDSAKVDFKAQINKDDPYQVLVEADFKEGKKYELTVPKGSVFSFYDSNSKSYRFDFATDKTENYGSLQITLMNPPLQNFWLQLVDENQEVQYSHYGKENIQMFKSLKPSKYTLRILVDNNENGLWEGADPTQMILAEDVYIYPKPLDVRPMWEMRETWDLQMKDKADLKAEP